VRAHPLYALLMAVVKMVELLAESSSINLGAVAQPLGSAVVVGSFEVVVVALGVVVVGFTVVVTVASLAFAQSPDEHVVLAGHCEQGVPGS
jgi:hypothetical protein